jgi:hypothetical protein
MKVTVSIRDAEAKLSTMTFYKADGADRAADLASATALVTAINGLTDGVVARHEVAYEVDGSATVPTGQVDNEIKATFGFLNSDGTISRISVPSFDRTKLLPGDSDVDLADAEVVAFVDEIEGAYRDYRDATLNTLVYAKEAYTRRQD